MNNGCCFQDEATMTPGVLLSDGLIAVEW